MPSKMRRHFSGAMHTRIAQDGSWRIERSDPAGLQIIVRGADRGAVQACGAVLQMLEIEWRAQRVLITARSAGSTASLEARGAIVHEALPQLYAALPLAEFDARARRFWRRVFFLVRLPGGRRLLRLLARPSRGQSQ